MNKLGVVFIATAISLLMWTVLPNQITSQNGIEIEPAFKSVAQTNTLRCGYGVWPPNLSKDPNTGALSGISYDVMSEIAKALKWKIEWVEEVPLGNAAEGLKTHRYDAYCTTLYIRPNNIPVVEFAGPIFFAALNVYSAVGKSQNFKSIAQLNSPEIRIGMIDGTIPHIVATADFPDAKQISLPDKSEYAENMLLVTTGKADVTFVEAAVAEHFMKANPNRIEVVQSLSPLRVFPTAFTLNRGEYALANTLTRAIEHLRNNGTLDRILDKYDPDQKLYMRMDKPYGHSLP